MRVTPFFFLKEMEEWIRGEKVGDRKNWEKWREEKLQFGYLDTMYKRRIKVKKKKRKNEIL